MLLYCSPLVAKKQKESPPYLIKDMSPEREEFIVKENINFVSLCVFVILWLLKISAVNSKWINGK